MFYNLVKNIKEESKMTKQYRLCGNEAIRIEPYEGNHVLFVGAKNLHDEGFKFSPKGYTTEDPVGEVRMGGMIAYDYVNITTPIEEISEEERNKLEKIAETLTMNYLKELKSLKKLKRPTCPLG